jgi:hypothetical protein
MIDASTTPAEITIPAWVLYSWAPVLWQASSAPDLHLVHLGTRVLTRGDEDGPCCGQTLWCNNTNQCAAGVAWDWVELCEGVVAMSDPMCMMTNLCLLGDDGVVLDPTQLAMHLHPVVHALPWQNEVTRVLRLPS